MRYLLSSLSLVPVIFLLIFFYNKSEVKALETMPIKPKTTQELNLIKKPLTPNISVKDKKIHFRNIVIPAVNKVYNELNLQYKETLKLIENNSTTQEITKLKKIYKINSDEELLMALKPHPKSITITQAAMESAWLTSRFYKEANNIFGVWSVNKNEPRIAALIHRGNKTIWLKKYSNIEDSIRDYYKTIARSSAYKEFRELKMKTDDPYELVKKLDKYSELGEKYGEELSSIIKYNKFYLLDEKP